MRPRKLISIVVPVYNEESNIPLCYEILKDLCTTLEESYDFEFIFTDNHSSDQSFNKLTELASCDSRVKVLRFSRNFGYQASIYTGYLQCTGDAAIQFDCDMQDPVEMIPEFLSRWEAGYKVVYGVRVGREEGMWITGLRLVFYRIISWVSRDPLPVDAGDFRLVDRCIVEEMAKVHDTRPYLRGMISSFGFPQVGVEYHRNKRLRERSTFNFLSYLSLAWDGLTNHSIAPLRLATIMGFAITAITVVFIIVYFLGRIFLSTTMPAGFATLVILLLFSILLNAVFLGIIGEYLGRIYLQVKRMPITIIEKRVPDDDPKDPEN
jgi:dolichol-phosphate mannosyltransferase